LQRNEAQELSDKLAYAKELVGQVVEIFIGKASPLCAQKGLASPILGATTMRRMT
jgi:hypothetical protein